MKRLLLITLLIGYIYPCVAQDKPIRTEESLEGTVIYKKTTTFEVDGYTYQCDVDDGSQFVTLYNKENKKYLRRRLLSMPGSATIAVISGLRKCNWIRSENMMMKK